MKIGGLQKLTLIDYPGKVAATVFSIGCNFRCPYCHNPELVIPEKIKKHPEIKQEDFFKFLDKRKDLLEGVCITGGEPTIHQDLPEFIGEIKKRGFLVKLDTNGSNYRMLKQLIERKLIDFVAMDVKTSFAKYEKLKAGDKVPEIKKSIELIKNKISEYEFRITIVPGIVDQEDVRKIGKVLAGAKKFVIQQFKPGKTLDPAFEDIQPYPSQDIQKMVNILEADIKNVELRK